VTRAAGSGEGTALAPFKRASPPAPPGFAYCIPGFKPAAYSPAAMVCGMGAQLTKEGK
jgi:hypothetical protein